MLDLSCPQCGTEFKAYPSQRRVYCSAACRVAAGVAVKKKTGRNKPCEICGTEFWVIPAREATARYCSVSCKDTAPLLAEHECVQCQTTFTAWPSERRRYCSTKCSAEHKTFRKGSPCETCGTQVDPKKNQNRFCSLPCAHAAVRTGKHVPCARCGVPVFRKPNQLARTQLVYCSRECKTEDQKIDGPGKLFTLGSGYQIRYFPKHPDATKNGSILEHRWVMEQKIGRRLLRSEHVHHINGIKDDNRPENLELMGAAEHQRVTVREATAKRRKAEAELAEYRRRYGSLEE